jgi:hypothetical protein
MQIHSVGTDLGRQRYLVALSAAGKVLLRKKFTRKQLIAFTADLQISLIGMEASAGAPGAWRPIRRAPSQARAVPLRSMARCAGDPVADQRGGHGGSQQAGSRCLGRYIKRSGLSRTGKRRGRLRRCGIDAFGLEALIALPLSRTTTTTKSSHQGLHRIAKTNERFPTACSQPAPEKWSSMTVPFIRKST